MIFMAKVGATGATIRLAATAISVFLMVNQTPGIGNWTGSQRQAPVGSAAEADELVTPSSVQTACHRLAGSNDPAIKPEDQDRI
jgi:hypothetical protein